MISQTDATVVITLSEVLEDERAGQLRSLAVSSAMFQAKMAGVEVAPEDVKLYEKVTQITTDDGVVYAHVFGWYLVEA